MDYVTCANLRTCYSDFGIFPSDLGNIISAINVLGEFGFLSTYFTMLKDV